MAHGPFEQQDESHDRPHPAELVSGSRLEKQTRFFGERMGIPQPARHNDPLHA
jgi:hypothetical protein